MNEQVLNSKNNQNMSLDKGEMNQKIREETGEWEERGE